MVDQQSEILEILRIFTLKLMITELLLVLDTPKDNLVELNLLEELATD